MATATSTACTSNTAEATLSALLVSGRFIWEIRAWLVTTLPPDPAFTVPVMASTPTAPGLKLPTSQMPVTSSNKPVLAP